MKKNYYGILYVLPIACVAYVLGIWVPIIGGPVFGILLGMVLAPIKRPFQFEPGIKYTGKKILQLAIILLGFGMNLNQVMGVGKQSLIIILFTLFAAFFTAFLVGKLLKINSHTTILIGVGTAICGGSAIAATAPVIEAEEKEIAYAISTIFLFNVMAVFIFPFIGHLMNMSDTGFGLWSGTAINDTSSVVAASYSYSDAAGQFAVIVKLTRTLMIIPITFILGMMTAKKKQHENRIHIIKIIPWFIFGFVATSILRTINIIPQSIIDDMSIVSKFLIVMALVAIGLNTHIKQFIDKGYKPILLGLLTWASVALTSLLIQYLLNIL